MKDCKKVYHSKMLNDNYIMENGNVVFKSGPVYTKREMALVKDMSDEEKITLHIIKQEFGGTIEEV